MSELLEYKCPACGGALEFDAATQQMLCPYCDSQFAIEDLKAKDEVLNREEPPADSESQKWNTTSHQWDEDETAHMRVYTCNSCGGEIVGDENTAASECPFCGNQVVMTGSFSGDLKPDYVIPFKLDKKAAKQKYLEHVTGKFLMPKLFKEQNHIDEIKGIYVPFWLYDSKVYASANFEAENVRTWSDSKYNYTETSVYDVHREGTMEFNNVPCDGSSKMDDALMESIEPFDFSEAVPFQTAYLAGYFADKYDVDDKENNPRANNRVLESAIDVLRDTVTGYDSVTRPFTSIKNERYDNSSSLKNQQYAYMNVLEGSVKYALYPVWLLTTTYKGEQYTFAMNGQTGKFVGDLPVDKHKKRLTFASIFAGVSAVATYLFYLFLG